MAVLKNSNRIFIGGMQMKKQMKKLTFIVTVLLPFGPCMARTIYVDAAGGGDFAAIQAAVLDANGGDTIIVRPGTYSGAGNYNINFLGKTLTVQSINPEDPAVVAATVIDCGTLNRAFSLAGVTGAVLDGLTITNGKSFLGGGIYCYSGATVTVRRCVISSCTASFAGGGIVSGSSANVTVQDTAVINNAALSYGGGVYCAGAQMSLENCLVRGNTTSYGGSGAFDDGDCVMSLCTLSDNTGSVDAGALYCLRGSNVTVRDSILWDNNSGIYLGTSTLTVLFSDVMGGEGAVVSENSSVLNWQQGNINADPLFVAGPLGDSYLSQAAAGQSATSPCVDAGSGLAADLGMSNRTTRTDGSVDSGKVDMGYHYPASELVIIKAQIDIDPDTINLSSQGKWIVCYIRLEAGYDSRNIVPDSVVLEDTVKAQRVWFDNQQQLTQAMFSRSAVANILKPGAAVEVSVSGNLQDGTVFAGSDVLKVKAGKKP